MKKIDFESVLTYLSQRLQLEIIGNEFPDRLELRVKELEHGIGFKIKVSTEWRTLTAEFIPDNFSLNLLKVMSDSNNQQKHIFKSIAEQINYDIIIKINNHNVDSQSPNEWSSNWNHLYIKLTKSPCYFDEYDSAELKNLIIDISEKLFELILSLIPIEDKVDLEYDKFIPEGSKSIIEVNKYERSILNRQICIRANGVKCKVCEFDFEKVYGDIGRDFIHVHHIIPLSTLGEDYQLNPIKELVPVCPNCHAMLHKKNPPYTIEELKKIKDYVTTKNKL